MMTKLGIICGEILELLEQSNGMFVFGEVQSRLKQPRDLVLMGLGWLLHEGYIQIVEDPLRACYQSNREKRYSSDASMFDLIIENKFTDASEARVKDMTHHINAAADKILTLLGGCGLLDLQTIEHNLNEHRDIVLMGLGWLIREGHVHEINGARKIPLYHLQEQPAEANFLCSV